MKIVLKFILITLCLGLGAAGYLVFDRFSKNSEQVVPFPYQFVSEAPKVKLDAPILIIGDRMGEYFSKFKEQLALNISINLANSIKIQSMAKSGHGLHRTLHELRSLAGWPQILVYQGGSEEFMEMKFNQADMKNIRENFKRYRDDRIETAMILYPWLSRLIYEPINRIKLAAGPELLISVPELDYLQRLDTELMLFEQELIQLANLSKDRSSLLILTTTPVNLDILPKRTCSFTSNMAIDKEIYDMRELLKAGNPKEAFKKSSKLISQHVGNATLYYIHGQIAKRLGQLQEAKKSLLNASAYDCNPWRSSELQNAIIRKVAREQQVLLFDFARFVNKDYSVNTTFFDELHPQNLYYEKGMLELGKVIKSILKL